MVYIYNMVSLSNQKSKRPVRSIDASEILAAEEAIDEGKILAYALSLVLGIRFPLYLVVAAKTC